MQIRICVSPKIQDRIDCFFFPEERFAQNMKIRPLNNLAYR